MKIVVFFEPKSWWKDDIYWLLKSSCFELFGDGKYGLFLSQEFDWKDDICWLRKSSCFELFGGRKYGLFLSQKVDGKMIFTDYRVLVLNFLVMGNTIFFSAKKLMERWYLLGLFELSMIFQDLENTHCTKNRISRHFAFGLATFPLHFHLVVTFWGSFVNLYLLFIGWHLLIKMFRWIRKK